MPDIWGAPQPKGEGCVHEYLILPLNAQERVIICVHRHHPVCLMGVNLG